MTCSRNCFTDQRKKKNLCRICRRFNKKKRHAPRETASSIPAGVDTFLSRGATGETACRQRWLLPLGLERENIPWGKRSATDRRKNWKLLEERPIGTIKILNSFAPIEQLADRSPFQREDRLLNILSRRARRFPTSNDISGIDSINSKKALEFLKSFYAGNMLYW